MSVCGQETQFTTFIYKNKWYLSYWHEKFLLTVILLFKVAVQKIFQVGFCRKCHVRSALHVRNIRCDRTPDTGSCQKISRFVWYPKCNDCFLSAREEQEQAMKQWWQKQINRVSMDHLKPCLYFRDYLYILLVLY